MALCQYCGLVEVAWHQGAPLAPTGRWTACVAQHGPDGQVIKREVKNGKGRVVARPIPDPSMRHYPHPHYGPNAAQRAPSECAAWAPDKVAPKVRRAPRVRPEPQAPELAPEVDIDMGTPKPAPPMVPTPQPAPVPVAVDEAGIRRTVRSEMVQVLDEYGVAPPAQVIEVKANGQVRKVDSPTHVQVPELVRLLGRGVHVYLYGGAGGGKTHAAGQALDACIGKSAVITMPGITAGKLFGFTDAGGRFVRTAFVDAYEHGGGIVLDELDRALPQVASALNSVLENRRAVFNGAEVPMHADFRLVATGNTDMRGGNRTYTGAQPLDLATAARFRFIRWRYDEALESALVAGVIPKAAATPLLAWARKMRTQLEQDRHDTVFCGPRETMRMAADLAAGESMEDAAHGWVFRGLEAGTVTRLLSVCPLPVIAQVRK